MEIPSNVILQRIGPTVWIPVQIIVWGLAELLTYRVTNAGGWYTARIFLGSELLSHPPTLSGFCSQLQCWRLALFPVLSTCCQHGIREPVSVAFRPYADPQNSPNVLRSSFSETFFRALLAR